MKKEKEGGAILIFQKRFFFSKMKKFSGKIENLFILDVMLKKGEQRERERVEGTQSRNGTWFGSLNHRQKP